LRGGAPASPEWQRPPPFSTFFAARPPRLLRPGHITPAQIEAVIGPIERGVRIAVNQPTPLPSPGLLERHYAPRTPLSAIEGSGRLLVEELAQSGQRIAWITIVAPISVPDRVRAVPMPKDARAYAIQLYATLHQLDHERFDRIVVDLPPATEEWLAVRDRLLRAAT